ncbi:MAG: EAL domain-containing protein [Gallionella sp.]|nr:EAL domain-containing protein [Gallionella sp.]
MSTSFISPESGWHTAPWAGLALVLFVLVTGMVILVDQQHQREIGRSQENARHELQLLSSIVTNELQSNNYQGIDSLLREWGEHDPDIIEVRLITTSGFALGHYQRSVRIHAPHTFETRNPLRYSYRDEAMLSIRMDMQPAYQHRDLLAIQLTAVIALIGVLLGLVVRSLLHRQREAALQREGDILRERTLELDRSNNALRDEIEQRQRAEMQLYEAKERAEVTLHSIGDAVISTDAGGRIEYLNPTAEKLTGWTGPEARGRPLAEIFCIVNEQTRDALESPVERVLREGRTGGLDEHTLLIARDGGETAIDESAAPICDRNGQVTGVVLVFHDVGHTRRLTSQLTHQATHDSLTGLPNRAEFESRLQQLVESARPDPRGHAMGYLDMDQFKVVNDTCGHTAGDELLRQFSSLLREHVRDSDVVARLGGDEFGILLIHCDPENAERSINALLGKIRKYRFLWEEHSFDVGASIGLVSIAAGQCSLSQIMSAADVACYAAKDAGRNRLHIYHSDDNELRQRHTNMQWVSRLRKAIDENRLCLYAQPIVPVARPGAPIHHEILLRLRDEQGQLVPPNAFIPAAERYNLMPQIDRWVLRATLDLMRGLAGNCRLAINISGQSLCDADFLRFATEQIDKSGINPDRLCFEITETAAIAHLNLAKHFISTLRAKGCLFSLDDFGSGLSSFAYLKNMKVDYLKIDGGFVKDMVDDPIDRAMVAAIHGVGQAMGIRTIAEFVETPEILAALAKIGVDYAQGYGIARPMPVEECLPAACRAAG